MGKSSKPPPAPDYTAATDKQAAANKQNLTEQDWANRPTQKTPWGTESWASAMETDPATGKQVPKWTQTTTLDPELEKSLRDQLGIQSGRSDIAGDMIGQVRDQYKTPFDWGGLPAAPGDTADKAQETAYQRMQELGAPERTHTREGLDRDLANSGITPGSPQYERAKRLQAEGEGRQDLQYALSSGAEGRAMGGYQQGLRGNAISEQAQRRGMPLNELNALISGQQVQMPGMPGVPQAGMAETPDYMKASGAQYSGAADAYNAKQGGKAQTQSAVGNVAMIAAMAF